MEKDIINGMKMNIIKENIKMELKKEKEKLKKKMEINLFVILLMGNLMELDFMKIIKGKEKKLNLLTESLIRNIKKIVRNFFLIYIF